MSFRKPVTKKEFAREVFVGVLAVACLFAIFLFVALQKSTGRSLSPLAYLWPESFEKADERIPVVVFRNDQVREKALSEVPFADWNRKRNKLANKTEQPGKLDSADVRKNLKLASRENTSRDQSAVNQKGGPGKIPVIQSDRQNFPVAQAGFSDSKKSAPKKNLNSNFQNRPPSQAKSNFQPSSNQFNTKPNSNATIKPSANLPFTNNKTRTSPRPVNPRVTDSNPPRSTFDEPKREIESRPSGKQNEPFTRQEPSKPKPDEPISRSDIVRNSLRIKPLEGDSFLKISKRYYGDGKYYQMLAEFNGRTNLSDGVPDPVLVPTLNDLRKASQLKPSQKIVEANKKADNESVYKTYRTEGGETLFEIAREELGNATRYLEIYNLNRSRLPADCDSQTRLSSGISLSLPKD